MKFLDDIQICRDNFGIQFVIRMNHSWRKAAEKFPIDKIYGALEHEISLGNDFLRSLEQKMELRIEKGYGFSGINLIPGAQGLDLQDSQNSYVGHNLTSPLQIAALTPVILRYLKDLELFSKERSY